MSKLVVIDGNAIMHRAYHAMPPLTTPEGEPIGAVHGFMNMLSRIIEDISPSHLAICFDRKEKTFRHEKYAKYQSHRPPTHEELSTQFEKIRKLLDSTGIISYDKVGYEADDLIGTLARQAIESAKIDEVIIVTGDKDQMQLVTDRVKLYFPIRGLGNAQLYDEKEVEKKLGVRPDRVVDLKALTGDPSDNYPGVHGIGPKTAVNLLNKFDTYEGVYKNLDKISESTRQKLIDGRESGEISYELAKIVTDVDFDYDLSKLNGWSLTGEKAMEVYSEFGMRSLPSRLLDKSKTDRTYKTKLGRDDITRVAEILVKHLPKGKWAIRGTASLILQGINLIADDVDVICDSGTALLANEVFRKYVVNKISHQKTRKYDSYFGEFDVDGIKVEFMGDWMIRKNNNGKKKWSGKYSANPDQITYVSHNNINIPVTKLETELEMFAAMGRWNAYHKIKKLTSERLQQRLF